MILKIRIVQASKGAKVFVTIVHAVQFFMNNGVYCQLV